MKEIKTNAMRILDSHNIQYSVHSYSVDEEHLDAVHAAKELNIDPNQLFKTIVMQGASNQLYVFCTPSGYEISLKKAREVTGEKAIASLPLKDLQAKTGYIRGGCSPLGMIKTYPTFIEESAQLYDKIYVSAGQRGYMLQVNPTELKEACNAEYSSFI